jgi:hypothetical protein
MLVVNVELVVSAWRLRLAPADVLPVPAAVVAIPADVLSVPADVADVSATVVTVPAAVVAVPATVVPVVAAVLSVFATWAEVEMAAAVVLAVASEVSAAAAVVPARQVYRIDWRVSAKMTVLRNLTVSYEINCGNKDGYEILLYEFQRYLLKIILLFPPPPLV